MPLLLSESLLDDYEARLCALGVPVVDALAPGLTDVQIDALLHPVGIDLPEEARVWWRWHNGTLPGSPAGSWDIAPFRSLLTLADVADFYREFDGFDEYRGWLSPTSEKPTLFFACTCEREAAVEVWSQRDWTEEPRLALPSIGELVRTWNEYVDAGIFRINADGSWSADYWKHLPKDVEELGVH